MSVCGVNRLLPLLINILTPMFEVVQVGPCLRVGVYAETIVCVNEGVSSNITFLSG